MDKKLQAIFSINQIQYHYSNTQYIQGLMSSNIDADYKSLLIKLSPQKSSQLENNQLIQFQEVQFQLQTYRKKEQQHLNFFVQKKEINRQDKTVILKEPLKQISQVDQINTQPYRFEQFQGETINQNMFFYQKQREFYKNVNYFTKKQLLEKKLHASTTLKSTLLERKRKDIIKKLRTSSNEKSNNYENFIQQNIKNQLDNTSNFIKKQKHNCEKLQFPNFFQPDHQTIDLTVYEPLEQYLYYGQIKTGVKQKESRQNKQIMIAISKQRSQIRMNQVIKCTKLKSMKQLDQHKKNNYSGLHESKLILKNNRCNNPVNIINIGVFDNNFSSLCNLSQKKHQNFRPRSLLKKKRINNQQLQHLLINKKNIFDYQQKKLNELASRLFNNKKESLTVERRKFDPYSLRKQKISFKDLQLKKTNSGKQVHAGNILFRSKGLNSLNFTSLKLKNKIFHNKTVE